MEFIINQRRVALFENLAFTNMTVSHERVVGMPSFRQIGDCLTAIRVFWVREARLCSSIVSAILNKQTSPSFFPMIPVLSKPSSTKHRYTPNIPCSHPLRTSIAADVLAASHKMSFPVTGIEEEEEDEIYFF